MSKNIFISWSSADQCIKDIAEGYKNWLNIIFDDKIEIFFSEEIEPAQNGIKQIHAALDKADVGLVFVTQRTACSPWVMYEFGCMYKLLEQEALYPILLDLDCKKLKEIAPPMADTQVVSLNNKDDNMHLIESIAKKLEISGSDILKIKNKAKAEYRHIDECVTEAQKNFANLPDTYVGEVPYNDTIMGSNNFQMPQIFDFYKKNIFLVGINLGMLFNIKSNSKPMEALIRSLVNSKEKTAQILISNLWDEKILYTYDKTLLGFGKSEYEYMNEVFFDTSSKYYLDTYIQNLCLCIAGDEKEKKYDAHDLYEAVKRQLLIKRIDLLMDTLWFVDNDEIKKQGSMLLAPLTARTGAERPVFYADKQKNERLYDSYFGVCKSGFEYTGSKVLWPVKE
jgi:hypothetical protein